MKLFGIAFGLALLCGCALFHGDVRGWDWDSVPESVRDQFRCVSADVKARTGWDTPKIWHVRGMRGEHLGTLCGQPMWTFSVGQYAGLGGNTDYRRGVCDTMIAVSPEGTAQYLAVYHEVFQGYGMANGRIRGNEHPVELKKYLPDNVRCMWR